MAQVRRHNWIELKADFARSSPMTVQAFSDARGLPYSAAKAHARDDGWWSARADFEQKKGEAEAAAVTKAAAKQAAFEYETAVSMNESLHRGGRNGKTFAHNRLAKLIDDPNAKPAAVAGWLDVLDRGDELQRRAAERAGLKGYEKAPQRIEIVDATASVRERIERLRRSAVETEAAAKKKR